LRRLTFLFSLAVLSVVGCDGGSPQRFQGEVAAKDRLSKEQVAQFKAVWKKVSSEFGKAGLTSSQAELDATKAKFKESEKELSQLPGTQNLARYQAVSKELERIGALEDLLKVRRQIQAAIKAASPSDKALDMVGAEMKLSETDDSFKALKREEEVAETVYNRLGNDLQELMMRLVGADPAVDTSKMPSTDLPTVPGLTPG